MAKAFSDFRGGPGRNMPIYRLCYWSVPRRRLEEHPKPLKSTRVPTPRLAKSDAPPAEPGKAS